MPEPTRTGPHGIMNSFFSLLSNRKYYLIVSRSTYHHGRARWMEFGPTLVFLGQLVTK